MFNLFKKIYNVYMFAFRIIHYDIVVVQIPAATIIIFVIVLKSRRSPEIPVYTYPVYMWVDIDVL